MEPRRRATALRKRVFYAISPCKPSARSTGSTAGFAASLAAWRELGLLTAKPVIYCANVDEAAVAEGNEFSAKLEAFAKERQSGFARICAKLEEELQGLPDEEQAELLSSYGIDESGLVRIIHTGYATLGLYSYFTAGPDEVRAWTIHKGWKAPQAAGVIHTDFERGFIRAEVISYADYMPEAVRATATVSFAAAKPGLALPEARPWTGALHVRSIGIPLAARRKAPCSFYVADGHCLAPLAKIQPGGFKNSYGHGQTGWQCQNAPEYAGQRVPAWM